MYDMLIVIGRNNNTYPNLHWPVSMEGQVSEVVSEVLVEGVGQDDHLPKVEPGVHRLVLAAQVSRTNNLKQN